MGRTNLNASNSMWHISLIIIEMCGEVLISYKKSINFPYKVSMRWTPVDYQYHCDDSNFWQVPKNYWDPGSSATLVNSMKLMSYVAKPLSYWAKCIILILLGV